MEVLIRYLCQCYHQPKEALFNIRCPYCNGRGYLERWAPYLLLGDVRVLCKDAYLIRGCRKIPASSPALSLLSASSPRS